MKLCLLRVTYILTAIYVLIWDRESNDLIWVANPDIIS